jgi:hypothetical protein
MNQGFLKIDPTVPSIGTSPLLLHRIPSTENLIIHGILKGYDFFVLSLFDTVSNINKLFLFRGEFSTAGISINWRLEFFS